MESWISQKGHPLLNIRFNSDRTKVTLRQKSFTKFDASATIRSIFQAPKASATWNIPINYAWSGENGDFELTSAMSTFSADTNTLDIEFATPVDWIVFNVKQTGLLK